MNEINDVFPDRKSKLVGIQNPKFRATAKSNGVMIQNRRNN